ncbi:MAG: YbhB/YbcL family Raf kinase inhibitor-like protein [Bryobacterales bacterium]|nr:YbhB/YbcL family Raf kinase inhibitor-like protein [Bryobacterales bacterium]MBV9399083.1 YbhB/YbcL family Raf kinase inhibitor-like protein [Bryobacterales bacterium]
MKLTCPVFGPGDMIPERYARRNGNVSPALVWSDVPSQAKSLALVVDDPDAPNGRFVHWLVYHIPPDIKSLDEGVESRGELSNGLRQGTNGFGNVGYGGPQPPSGTHRYQFHLYALDRDVDLPPGASPSELDSAINGHIVEETELVGKYRAK